MADALPITMGTPIQYARGVGPVRAKVLEGLGISTCGDLLTYYPRDYVAYSAEKTIGELAVGEVGTVRGVIVQTRMHQTGGRGKRRFEALLEDASAGSRDAGPHAVIGRGIPTRARCVLTWFNPWGVSEKVEVGVMLRVSGKVTAFSGRLQITNPHFEVLDGEEDAGEKSARVESVYSATEDLSSPAIAKLVRGNLDLMLPEVSEWFEEKYLEERGLMSRRRAAEKIHRPGTVEDAKLARRTLAYHEFFLHQTAVAIKRYHARNSSPAIPLRVDEKVDKRIRSLFEFGLTNAQNKVIESVRKDLASTKPMNRLLQGDVGSGKTVVALYAMLSAAATKRGETRGEASSKKQEASNFEGHQAALMAPTEILAEQHFITLEKYLKDARIEYALLTGSMPAAERKRVLAGIADGSIHIVVGTHALLSEGVSFKSLALVVIDEQHKFGVEQRGALRQRHGSPHVLVMTATPIPRTLAMTAFGDLDVSVIDELPPGRKGIFTRVEPAVRREEVYRFVAERVKAGEQVYVVLPAIDEGVLEIRSATQTQEELAKGWLKECRVGLIHGRQKQETRQHIMERFRQKLIDVLVATTVIEVGVDVPNATVMVIEHAERFGLSQLHQLRGRVGRGSGKSYAILVVDEVSDEEGVAAARMQAMVKHADGFAIAEEDLRLRGTGQLFGTAQSGRSEFHFADLLFDSRLLSTARRDAFSIVAADPRLIDLRNVALRGEVLKEFGKEISLADVG